MVRVTPFRGLRFNADVVGDWGAVLAPPYDVLDVAEATRLKSSNPYQVAHIECASQESEIDAAAQLLADWRKSGAVVQDKRPSFYVHEHRFGTGQIRRALFGAVELTAWNQGGVMAHEQTMPGPKETRTALRSTTGADISPLMAFAPDRSWRLARLLSGARSQPILNEGVDSAGDTHTMRRIDDPETVAEISDACAGEQLYVADGHHRYESALASIDPRNSSGSVLMGIVCASDPGLVVGATHRLIHAPIASGLVEKLRGLFEVAEIPVDKIVDSLPDGSSTMGLVTRQGVWLLRTTERARQTMPGYIPAAWRNLAPAVLQHAVLAPFLGIDSRTVADGQVLKYTHSLDEVLDSVHSEQASAGFVLPAPTLQDVIETAEAGSFMPQKSTYFFPKLPAGLVIHSFASS